MRTFVIVVLCMFLVSSCAIYQHPENSITKEELEIQAEFEYTKAMMTFETTMAINLILVKRLMYEQGNISEEELQDFIDGTNYLYNIKIAKLMKRLSDNMPDKTTHTTEHSN